MGVISASLNSFNLILQATLLVKLVLLTLAIFSVVSWAIIIQKWRSLGAVEAEDDEFLETFHEGSMGSAQNLARELRSSSLAVIFLSVTAEAQRLAKQAGQSVRGHRIRLNPLQVRLLMRHTSWVVADERNRLSHGLPFLATTGSTAPFIGLFGTVVGIINSFENIGVTGSASLATVAPGIAEALIATAFGLLAAIPATIFYNHFVSQLHRISNSTEQFQEELQEDIVELVSGGMSEAPRAEGG